MCPERERLLGEARVLLERCADVNDVNGHAGIELVERSDALAVAREAARLLDPRVSDRDERPADMFHRGRVLTPHQAGTNDRHTKAGRGHSPSIAPRLARAWSGGVR